MAVIVHGYNRLPTKGERDISVRIKLAAERIRQNCPNPDEAFVAFSGGKDSIVAGHIASRYLGITTAMMETSFYFQRDIPEYRNVGKAIGLNVEEREVLTMDFLRDNPQYVFMRSALLGSYYTKRQQKSIWRYSHENKRPYAIIGRRTQENTVYGPYFERRDGLKQIFPIYDWRAEHVWQYIIDHDIPYPSIYDTEIGRYEGATTWPEMTIDRWWIELKTNPLPLIDQYEPGLIESLAPISEVCREYLEGKA